MYYAYLTANDLTREQAHQIEKYGLGDVGVLNQNQLESSVAMPAHGFGGQEFYKDVFQKAAALLWYLTKNHPFRNGNKRTALAAALSFLYIHEVRVNAPAHDLFDIAKAVAGTNPPEIEDIAMYFFTFGDCPHGYQVIYQVTPSDAQRCKKLDEAREWIDNKYAPVFQALAQELESFSLA